MSSILFAAGSICLLYFLLLAMKHVDFCIIWLLGAIALYAWGSYLRHRMLHPEGWAIPTVISALLVVGLLAGGVSFVITEGKMIAAMSSHTKENLEYLIVLGAQVKKTVPSKALRLRLETACEYLEEHPNTRAVLSGGQGSGEEITEAGMHVPVSDGSGYSEVTATFGKTFDYHQRKSGVQCPDHCR